MFQVCFKCCLILQQYDPVLQTKEQQVRGEFQRALRAVSAKEIGLREASGIYNILKLTILKRLTGKMKIGFQQDIDKFYHQK